MTTEASPKAHGIVVTWRQLPLAVKALLLGVFINRLAAFIQIYLVLFLTHRGFSTGQAGIALGVYGAGAVLGSLLGGTLADRLTPRVATLISMGGSAVLIVSILYVRPYALILVAVTLVSLVAQMFRPAAQALITETVPVQRLVMVTAMYRLAINLGTTATPLLGAALLAVSYNLLFWGEAVAALLYAGIALVALPGRKRPAAEAERGSAEPAEARGGYLTMLADWRYTVFLTAVFLTSAVYIQYTSTLPLAIHDAGLSLWWYGAVVSLNSAVVIACELLMTRFVQNWPMRLTMFLGFIPVAIGYALYAIGMFPAVLVIGTLVWTSAEIIGAPTVFAYPGLTAPEHLRGRYIGAMQSLFGLGTAVGPIAGVLVWNHVGQAVWLWIAAVALLATVAAQVCIRPGTTQHADATLVEPSFTGPAVEPATNPT
jgi:MFS family permease